MKENDLQHMYDDENAMAEKYLTFTLAEEEYAVEIKYVRDIIQKQHVTVVPDTDPYLRGVINLRGKIIPVIDVRIRFGLAQTEYDERSCIIVVRMKDVLTGLIVDRVLEVMDVPDNAIDPPPRQTGPKAQQFLKGMGRSEEKIRMILDIDHLLHVDDMQTIRQVQKKQSEK